jgi:hypothetical protein
LSKGKKEKTQQRDLKRNRILEDDRDVNQQLIHVGSSDVTGEV